MGITCKSPETRWNNGNGYRGQWFYSAVQKWKWENIKHDVLLAGVTKEQAYDAEMKLIRKYHSYCPGYGYNDVMGGENRNKVQPVLCVETNEAFATANEAAEHYKIPAYSVKKQTGRHPFTFRYLTYADTENPKQFSFPCDKKAEV